MKFVIVDLKNIIRSIIPIRIIRKTAMCSFASIFERYELLSKKEAIYAFYRGCIDGIKKGKIILKDLGKLINIYRVPIIPNSSTTLQAFLTGVGLDFVD